MFRISGVFQSFRNAEKILTFDVCICDEMGTKKDSQIRGMRSIAATAYSAGNPIRAKMYPVARGANTYPMFKTVRYFPRIDPIESVVPSWSITISLARKNITFIAKRKQNATASVIGLIDIILTTQIAIVANKRIAIVIRDPNFTIDLGIIINPKIASNDPAEYNNPMYDSGIN